MIGGYGKPTDSLALAVLGAIVSGAVAFGAGALWGHVRKPKSQRVAQSMAWGDAQQAELGNSARIDEGAATAPDMVSPSGGHGATLSGLVSPVNDNQNFATASDEIEAGNLDKGLWARLYAETDGDEAKTKARYIKRRAAAIGSAEELRRAQKTAAAEADFMQMEIDRRQREGIADPALLSAVWAGNWATVAAMLKEGVSPLGSDEKGNTLLDLAKLRKDRQMIQLLESFGCE
jgi:hypothetical protein